MKLITGLKRFIKKRRVQKLRKLKAELRNVNRQIELAEEIQRLEAEIEIAELREQADRERLALEEQIHLARPGATLEDFVPEFAVWWRLHAHLDLNLVDALEEYVDYYQLVNKDDPDEPDSASKARVMLKVLESSNTKFEGSDDCNFQAYKESLEIASTMWLRRRRTE